MFEWGQVDPREYKAAFAEMQASGMSMQDISIPRENHTVENVANNTGGNEINVSFSLPNVKNADELVTDLQANPRFWRMLDGHVSGRQLGKNSLNRYKY